MFVEHAAFTEDLAGDQSFMAALWQERRNSLEVLSVNLDRLRHIIELLIGLFCEHAHVNI